MARIRFVWQHNLRVRLRCGNAFDVTTFGGWYPTTVPCCQGADEPCPVVAMVDLGGGQDVTIGKHDAVPEPVYTPYEPHHEDPQWLARMREDWLPLASRQVWTIVIVGADRDEGDDEYCYVINAADAGQAASKAMWFHLIAHGASLAQTVQLHADDGMPLHHVRSIATGAPFHVPSTTGQAWSDLRNAALERAGSGPGGQVCPD